MIFASSRTLKTAAAVAGMLASLAAVTSCILADPPPDLPKPPKHHPIIVKGSVVPPFTQVLPSLPSKFVVPVELIDPDLSFEWEVFVDYDPTNPHFADLTSTGPIAPTPSDVDGGVYTFEFDLATATVPDPSVCHRIELLVALGFSLAPHTPDSFGADSIVWFYNPSGDVSHCPFYDAGGADGAFPDAASDTIFLPPPPDGGE